MLKPACEKGSSVWLRNSDGADAPSSHHVAQAPWLMLQNMQLGSVINDEFSFEYLFK
jgi:hypothetical protein